VAFARDAAGSEVRLADDSRVTIRPIEPADAPLLVAAFAELSEDLALPPFLHAEA
jgi:hypothetical protein